MIEVVIEPSSNPLAAPVTVISYPDGHQGLARRRLTDDEAQAALDAGACVTYLPHAVIRSDGDLSPFDVRCLLGERPDANGELPERTSP